MLAMLIIFELDVLPEIAALREYREYTRGENETSI